jgi:hypothetical protein
MIAAGCEDLVAALRAGGVRAAVDLADLDLPGVLVEPPVLRYRFGKSTADADWTLIAAVPDNGRRQSIVALSTLVEQVRAALAGSVVGARPAGLFTTDSLVPQPAYALTYTSTITEPKESTL